MNLAGMTLKEIGEKLGASAASVCRDLEWVRHQWRKSAVRDFEEARAGLRRIRARTPDGYIPVLFRRATHLRERRGAILQAQGNALGNHVTI